MRNISHSTETHPVAQIVLEEIPEPSNVSEQGIVQFILTRGLAKLKDAEVIARDIHRAPTYA